MKNIQTTAQARQRWQIGQRAAQSQQWQLAAQEFERAARLAPREASYWTSLALARIQRAQPVEAQLAAQQAFTLEPDNPLACKLLVESLSLQRRFDDAVAACAQLPAHVARDEPLLMLQANALLFARRPQEAVGAYIAALKVNILNAAAHHRLGLALQQLNLPGDAAVCFETAITTDKEGRAGVRTLALSHLVQQLRQAGEWAKLAQYSEALLAELSNCSDTTAAEITPFALLSMESTPAQQLRVVRQRSRLLAQGLQQLPPRGQRAAGRLRIGYLSSDFCNHATSMLVAELLELRDVDRFEVFLYCHSPADGSALQQRVRAAADHYRDVRHIGDGDVARLMRDDGIDIAVDLKGHTQDNRLQILGYRPAPVQLSYLGFPGSTGASFIDYLVGDSVVTPLAHEASYSERIAQMPASYQPNDSRRALPSAPERAALGLPGEAIVLSCFNQTYKISPAQVDLWAQILLAAPATVLWLLAWNPKAQANLAREFAARGVGADRLVFAPLASPEDNLARLQCADLFLDTWPCNAHTTASEALWAGVPVLTVPGETFASRVAASLVQACELPAFVCASPQAYVDKAIALLADPSELRAAQQHLRSKRLQLPLFDSQRYSRDFEALLLRMWARHEAGLPPDNLPAMKGVPA